MERVFGSVSSKMLIMVFYFVALLLMAAPGVILGVMATIFFSEAGIFPAFVGMACGNIVISLLVLYLCRNLLQFAELNNR